MNGSVLGLACWGGHLAGLVELARASMVWRWKSIGRSGAGAGDAQVIGRERLLWLVLALASLGLLMLTMRHARGSASGRRLRHACDARFRADYRVPWRPG